jgi:hypothetical protein
VDTTPPTIPPTTTPGFYSMAAILAIAGALLLIRRR